MQNILVRTVLGLCILLTGCTTFACSLSGIELQQTPTGGKIILNTDKSSIDKKIISDNKIQLKLKNTSVIDTTKNIYSENQLGTDISVIQKGKDTFINLSGEKVSKYELVYADNNNFIPVTNHKQDASIAFLIFGLILCLAKLSSKINAKKEQNPKLQLEYIKNIDKINNRENTLRNKVNKNQCVIHGAPVLNFSGSENNVNFTSVTVPREFKNSKVKYLQQYSELKKAVNA